MESVFLKILNMSITASWLVVAVVLLRLLLKRAPKIISLILWALVGVRLILPVSLESVFSLIPSAQTFSSSVTAAPSPSLPSGITSPDAMSGFSSYTAPIIQSGIPILDSSINPILSETFAPNAGDSADPIQVIAFIATIVWAAGVAAMLLYALISYIRLRLKVREAVKYEDNIMLCDNIASPFILGIIRPKIYIPSSVGEQDMYYVLAHENAHLKRRDHFWKPLGFFLLSVYWFNPVLWVAYILLCRDIELACDEKVIKSLGIETKKPYSTALVNCSVSRRALTVCPLAFGEVGVKKRVKTVLNYKKPAFWIIIVALITCIVVAVCFLTNPTSDINEPTPKFQQFSWTIKPRTITKDGKEIPYKYDETTATWLTFSKTNHNTEREAIKLWLKDELDSLKESMGADYYEPIIYIAKYDIDNNGTDDSLAWINHIGYTGSAGSSLSVMYFDGAEIIGEEYIAHFKLDESTIENEENKQVGIYPVGEYNDISILGNIWMRSTDAAINPDINTDTTNPDKPAISIPNKQIATDPDNTKISSLSPTWTGDFTNDPFLDSIECDLDGDGATEYVRIYDGTLDKSYIIVVWRGSLKNIGEFRLVNEASWKFDGFADGVLNIKQTTNNETSTLRLSVKNGQLVLDGSNIESSELTDYVKSVHYRTSSFHFDIDADGIKESCVVIPDAENPYSYFSFIVTSDTEALAPEYFNVFSYDGIEKLEFIVNDTGKIMLQGTREGVTLTFNISIKDGKIVLAEKNGNTLTYVNKAFGLDTLSYAYNFDYPDSSMYYDIDGDGENETIYVGYESPVSCLSNFVYVRPYAVCVTDGEKFTFTSVLYDLVVEKEADGKLYLKIVESNGSLFKIGLLSINEDGDYYFDGEAVGLLPV